MEPLTARDHLPRVDFEGVVGREQEVSGLGLGGSAPKALTMSWILWQTRSSRE